MTPRNPATPPTENRGKISPFDKNLGDFQGDPFTSGNPLRAASFPRSRPLPPPSSQGDYFFGLPFVSIYLSRSEGDFCWLLARGWSNFYLSSTVSLFVLSFDCCDVLRISRLPYGASAAAARIGRIARNEQAVLNALRDPEGTDDDPV